MDRPARPDILHGLNRPLGKSQLDIPVVPPAIRERSPRPISIEISAAAAKKSLVSVSMKIIGVDANINII